jgi:hypothetical protein
MLLDEIEELRATAAALASDRDFGDRSEQVNRRILELIPDDVASMTRLAKCLMVRDTKDEAKAIYERVLEIDASNTIARNALAGLLDQKGDSRVDGGRRPGEARRGRPGRQAAKPRWRPRVIEVAIPDEDIRRFGEELKQQWYADRERNYKLAVHHAMAALLSPASQVAEDLPARIADVFGSNKPDLVALGLDDDARRWVQDRASIGGGLRGAFSNLCGGRFGYRQFSWIPDAVRQGFGEPVADAFRRLVDDSQALATRVDDFRSDLTFTAGEFGRRGGVLPHGEVEISLAFAAVVLGGFDPSRYTFYMAGSLRRGYEYYARGSDWPTRCSMGERYEDVCAFVKSVEQALLAGGLPVRDLIDAQSFMWLRYRPQRTTRPDG